MNQPVSSDNQSNPPVDKRHPRSGADRSDALSFGLTAALCTLLGVNLMVMAFGRSGPAPASAQVTGYSSGAVPPNGQPSGVQPAPENIPSAPASSPEMIKRLIEQQVETNARLARIESLVAGPHAVTVTNWPPAPAK